MDNEPREVASATPDATDAPSREHWQALLRQHETLRRAAGHLPAPPSDPQALITLLGTLSDSDARDALVAALYGELAQLVRDELRAEIDRRRGEQL